MSDTRKPGSHDKTDDLERLRELILGEHSTHLDTLYRRVDDPKTRTSDVAEVLPAAINHVIADPVTQPEIERPIVDTIRNAIMRDTESFAEALFPVLGPAIRRAVSDALKSLVQRINLAMEHSFTVKSLRWRVEATRSGVPFAQIVLRETMLYAVQEVFLIQPRSGLVLASAHRADTLVLDEDAFSAMLTAIQAFIQDSLGMPEGEKLRSAELGDRSLWVVNGPDAVLACLVVGSPPLEVRTRLMDTLETVHARFGAQLDRPPEQVVDRPAIEHLLQEVLSEEVAEDVAKGESDSRSRLLWTAAGLALLAFLAWGAWDTWHTRQLQQEITAMFESQPGYMLASHGDEDGKLQFNGLRDPLSIAPDVLLQGAGIEADKVTFSFRPFQSLEEDFVLRRLRASLGDDNAVTLALSGTVLNVSGSLTPAQYAVLQSLPGSHPLIVAIDFTQVHLSSREAEAQVRRKLNAPDSVLISASENHLLVSGISDAAWFREARSNTISIDGWTLDFAPLRTALTDHLDTLLQDTSGRVLLFTRLFDLAPAAQNQLNTLGEEISEIQELAAVLDTNVVIRLVGYSDGVGTLHRNNEIAQGRAYTVQAELVSRGVDPAIIVTEAGAWQAGNEDPDQRKVVVQLTSETTQ